MSISDEQLDRLQKLSDAVDAPEWRAWVEGRDFESGESVITVGPPGAPGEDIYLRREGGADANLLDFIAISRNAIPLLVAEIRRLRARHSE